MDTVDTVLEGEALAGYRSILLVEDQAVIALAEASILRGGGYSVRTSMKGEEAVAIVSEGSAVDIILMDIDLGKGMDGTQAAELILKDRDMPIVFMSSHAEPEIVHKTDKIASYGYIVKGSPPTTVFASLRMAERLHKAKRGILQQEEELRNRANEYRWLVESMINAFVIWGSVFDGEGRYVDMTFEYFNDAYSKVSGLELEAVRGKRVYRDVWPSTEPGWREVYGSVALTGLPETFEMSHSPTRGRYLCRAYRPWPGTDRICVVFEEVREGDSSPRPR